MNSLLTAIKLNHVEVVRLLLADPRTDPSAWNNYAIRLASENKHKEVVELLQKALYERQ
jgi:hypothetical protein